MYKFEQYQVKESQQSLSVQSPLIHSTHHRAQPHQEIQSCSRAGRTRLVQIWGVCPEDHSLDQ